MPRQQMIEEHARSRAALAIDVTRAPQVGD